MTSLSDSKIDIHQINVLSNEKDKNPSKSYQTQLKKQYNTNHRNTSGGPVDELDKTI